MSQELESLVERLATEVDLIDAGMNMDDGQTVECLRDAAARIEALEAVLKPFAEEAARQFPTPPKAGQTLYGIDARHWLAAAAALAASEPKHDDRDAVFYDACPICDQPKITGQLMLADASLGEVHAACCGPEREGYVNLETGEPIGPNEPIPEGYPYEGPGEVP